MTEKKRGKQYTIRWTCDTPEGRKRKTRTVYGTYAQACAELDRLHVSITEPRTRTITVGEAYSLWQLPREARLVEQGKLRDSTRELHARNWSRHCAPRWQDVPIAAVRPLDVQEWLASLPRASAKVCKAVMRQTFGLAVKYEACRTNPFELPYDLGEATRAKTRRVLTLDEAAALAETLRGSTLIEGAFLLAAFGSCRTGESLGVRCDEISDRVLGSRHFAVAKVERTAGPSSMSPDGQLKTAASRRVVILPPPWSAQLLTVKAERLRDGYEWITPKPTGEPMGKKPLAREWAKFSELPFSNLRNSWRTFAQYDWRVPPDTLEVLMGHKLPGVTGAHYLRPSTEQLLRDFARAFADS